MRARTIHTFTLLACLVLLAAWGGETRAANFFEKNFWLDGPRYEGAVPPCDAPWALNRITQRFSEKEGKFWNSALQIVAIERVREVAFRPGPEYLIPRRFCSATAIISDGAHRTMNFSIGEDTGMIGASWGVEWCVIGLDRNWAYNPSCKMALP
jgi:hypothetical protein